MAAGRRPEGDAGAAGPERVDLLVTAGTAVTMDPARRVLRDAGVAVRQGAIVAVGARPDLLRRYRAEERLDVPDGTLTPGYVDAHQHLTGDRLARCTIPDDLAPGESIFAWAVPLHAAHRPDDDELSATLAAVEAVTNGVTTVIEAGTVAHPDRVAAALTAVGVRGTVGAWGWDIEDGPFAAPAPEILDRLAGVLDAFPPDPRRLVRGTVTLVGHNLASDELFVGADRLARDRQALLTFHLSPTSSDPQHYLAATGRRPVAHLDHLGVLGPHLLLAHGVWFDDAEVELVLASGTAVAYCPWAYLRLAQGVSRVGRHAELVRRGGRVALGCDSENAGDQIDVLRAAALAAGLAKDMAIDSTALGATDVFELATVAGAEAVGLGGVTGSLEVGRRADLVVHRGDGPQWLPPGEDVALQLVWGTDGRSVRHVVIDGRIVVRDGRCVTVDVDGLSGAARDASRDLLRRAGLTPRPTWPVTDP